MKTLFILLAIYAFAYGQKMEKEKGNDLMKLINFPKSMSKFLKKELFVTMVKNQLNSTLTKCSDEVIAEAPENATPEDLLKSTIDCSLNHPVLNMRLSGEIPLENMNSTKCSAINVTSTVQPVLEKCFDFDRQKKMMCNFSMKDLRDRFGSGTNRRMAKKMSKNMDCVQKELEFVNETGVDFDMLIQKIQSFDGYNEDQELKASLDELLYRCANESQDVNNTFVDSIPVLKNRKPAMKQMLSFRWCVLPEFSQICGLNHTFGRFLFPSPQFLIQMHKANCGPETKAKLAAQKASARVNLRGGRSSEESAVSSRSNESDNDASDYYDDYYDDYYSDEYYDDYFY